MPDQSDNVGMQPPLVAAGTAARHEVRPKVLGARDMQGSQTEEILMSPKPELDRRLVESRGAHFPLFVYVRRCRHTVCPDQNVAATHQVKEMQQHFPHSDEFQHIYRKLVQASVSTGSFDESPARPRSS